MIEIPLDRFAHHRFKTLTSQWSVATFAKVREIRHQEHAHFIGVIKQERVVNFDMDAEEVEPHFLRIGDVIFKRGHVARSIDTFRIIRLMERPAQVTWLSIEPKQY